MPFYGFRRNSFLFSAFRWRKAAKATRPIPMPASGRLKAASGDYSRVCKQTVPAAVAFSLPSAFPPSEPSRESPCGVKNKAHVAETYLFLYRQRRHHQSALSFDAEKERAGCGVSATGWRIGLILRAPCSAAVRAIPRKTTCGGFWYFWPQKYKGKIHGTCRFSKIGTSEQKNNTRGRKRTRHGPGSGTKKADDFFKSSAVVAGGGLEPPTSGL